RLRLVRRARSYGRHEGKGEAQHDGPASSAYVSSSLLSRWRDLAREYDRNLNLSAPPQHFHRHVVAMPPDAQIDGRLTQLQLAQEHVVQERGQFRIAQPDLGSFGIEFEPER